MIITKVKSSKYSHITINTNSYYICNKDGKSRFEQQQEKMRKKIQELEEESIAKKDWTLLGEVSYNNKQHI
jgi:U3 small nucleolar ribonucleoprotein component